MLGHRDPILIRRQPGRDPRIEERPPDDVDEVEERQEEARQHRRGVELHDRLSGDRRVDDEHDRRRNENAERAARRDGAGGQLDVVARVQHRPQRDDAHEDDDRPDDARGDAPERAHQQGRHRQRRRHPPEGELDGVEHPIHQRRPLHDVAHEDEQRDRQQRVVRHDPVRPLHDQIEGAVLPPMLDRVPEREVAEDHPEAHQRERGREAHHDRDHDEPEHRETERGIAHGVGPGARSRPPRCGDAPPPRSRARPPSPRAATPRPRTRCARAGSR